MDALVHSSDAGRLRASEAGGIMLPLWLALRSGYIDLAWRPWRSRSAKSQGAGPRLDAARRRGALGALVLETAGLAAAAALAS